MSLYPGAAEVEIEEGPVAIVEIVRTRNLFPRSGRVTLQELVQEFNIEFLTALPSTEYNIVSLQVNNYVDNRALIPVIKAFAWGVKSQNYFQVRLDTPPPVGTTYTLEWAIAENYNP